MAGHFGKRGWTILLALLALAACGTEPASEAPGPDPAAVAETLAVPFTAEQIRDEWTPGLTIVFHFNFPDRQQWQRWTVVAADADGAMIEYQDLDAQGQPVAPPQRAPSRWDELRDHALFPAAEARRERVSHETVLGQLEGWLYEVDDPQTETVKKLFFADELPGAPVWMETRRGEEIQLTLNQIARQHLAGPPAGDPRTAPEPG
jgi:hypothetical protein